MYDLIYVICEFSGDLMEKPWDNWIPGVLNKGQMQLLVDEAILIVPNDTIGAASLDLTLTAEAYKMKCGSVKPGGDSRYSVILKDKGVAEKLPPPSDGIFILVPHRRCRPTGNETGVTSVVDYSSASGTEVVRSLVRMSPFSSWTRNP